MTESIPNATPFDLIQTDADDLLTEARAWADGQPVESQQQADEVSRLIEALRLNAKAADDARKDENKPHDDAKKAVQEKYAPLYADPNTRAPGKVFKAIDALKATLTPFLQKLDEEKRESERKAREAAERAAQEAAEAMRQASASSLSEREDAEAKIAEAEALQRAAREAEKSKAHASGGSRAMGLRTVRVAELADPKEAAGYFWKLNPEAFNNFLQKLADDEVRQGKRQIPGFTIIEKKVL